MIPLAQIAAAERPCSSLLGGGITAVLQEIAARLAALAADGTTASIDLRALPMAPAERSMLRQALGAGETTIEIKALGRSVFYETAYPGLWWVEHHDRSDAVVVELLEFCRVPEMVAATTGEIEAAAGRLRQWAADATRFTSTPTEPQSSPHRKPVPQPGRGAPL